VKKWLKSKNIDNAGSSLAFSASYQTDPGILLCLTNTELANVEKGQNHHIFWRTVACRAYWDTLYIHTGVVKLNHTLKKPFAA